MEENFQSIINNMNLPSFIPLFFGSSRNLHYYVHVSVRNKLLTGYKALHLCSQALLEDKLAGL